MRDTGITNWRGRGLSPSQSFAGSAESALSAEPTSDTLMEEIYTHRYTAVSQRNTREILPQRVRRLLRRMLRLLPLVRHPRRRHHRSHRGHCPDHPQKPVLRIPRIPDAPPTHRHTRQRIQRNRQLRIHDIYTHGIYELGTSTNDMYSHLATVEVQQPKTWKTLLQKKPEERHPHIYKASQQVVLEAERDPIGSLTKYFNIEADLQTLKDVQRLSDDIARLETAVDNVRRREDDMIAHINPPQFITKIYADEFWNKLNVCHVGLTVPYPIYRFEYTSPGGKENRAVTVTLDTPTLDALSETLERKIRWAWPEGGERTLMTAQLRQRIKERDNYTCQNPGCGNSIMRERILILEVVHKVPLSEGGNNEPDNLQTLCWRCVRGRNLRLA